MPLNEIPFDEQHDSASSLSSTSSQQRIRRETSSSASSNLSDSENSMNHIFLNNEMNLRDYEIPVYPPRYEKIILPVEPSLDELLRQVAGTTEIDKVEDIKLRVISSMISLQRIHLFMPKLISLNLDGSCVSSLRDLGCGLSILKYLNVSRCGLNNLDGTSGLLTIEELVADGNFIENVSPCCNLPELRKLSLGKNRVSSIEDIGFLALCPNLKCLDLKENEVTKNPKYRTYLKENIPQLAILDGQLLYDAGPEQCSLEISSSEYNSSTPEESLQISETNNVEVNVIERPSSSKEFTNVSNEQFNRPSTAGGINNLLSSLLYLLSIFFLFLDFKVTNLTSGEPFHGNIISKARRRRQHTAWGESTSSSSCSSGSFPIVKDFPNQIPQTSIALELGVIGNYDKSLENEEDGNSSGRLLDASRKWRQNSQTTRETARHADNKRILRDYTASE